MIINLTKTDLTIIYGITEGMTDEQIATELHSSASRVSNRIRYLRKAFNARTTAQLIAELYHHGVLNGKPFEELKEHKKLIRSLSGRVGALTTLANNRANKIMAQAEEIKRLKIELRYALQQNGKRT